MRYSAESSVSLVIAEVLSSYLGADCRTAVANNDAFSIRCYYRGLRVAIEASYDSSEAERRAAALIKEDLADVALALYYTKLAGEVSETEVGELPGGLELRAKILVPGEARRLLEYLESRVRIALPRYGWIKEINARNLADLVKHAADYVVSEVEVERELKRVKRVVNKFVKAAESFNYSQALKNRLAEVLARLYGFSVTGAEYSENEVIFGQTALAILLSAVFYENLRQRLRLAPIEYYLKYYGAIRGLRVALEKLLSSNKGRSLELAYEILENLPIELEDSVKDVVYAAISVAKKPHLLARDFAGRVYHRITGDITIRKGFATFYTETPAAYLLTSLALSELLGIGEKLGKNSGRDVEGLIEKIQQLKIADFACGSGALLTAFLQNASRVVKTECFLNYLECPDIEKRLIEEGVYGLDALKYATQIAKLNLVLMSPAEVSKENIFAAYIGLRPGRGTCLGSLELLEKDSRELSRCVEEASGANSLAGGESKRVEIPAEYDVIVMNPPFTRPTGRVGRRFGKGGESFLGFIAEDVVRESVLARYRRIRELVRRDLIDIAHTLFSTYSPVLRDLQFLSSHELTKAHGLDQYYGIGQAGEGLIFLYLAYRYVKRGGVIAFVLPRNLLSGVSWFLARALLVEKFHVKYVVVSTDSVNGYNFSENTGLSECLVIAKKVDEHNPSEETTFVVLLKKPKSTLEALLLSEELVRSSGTRGKLADRVDYFVKKVKRDEMLRNLDNLNRFAALPEPELVNLGLRLLRDGNLGVLDTRIPVVRLGELAESIGIDSPQFHEHFGHTSTKTPYPIVYSGREAVRSKMVVEPNAYAVPRTSKAPELFKRYSGRVLLPDRIWLDTAHVISMYSRVPVVSNVFYVVKLRKGSEQAEKALVYWLNTTWSLLTVLMNREETRGRWIRLKKAQWKLLPVLDTTSLSADALRRLAEVFDRYADKHPKRIPEQYSRDRLGADPLRVEIDVEFLRALNPSIDTEATIQQLREVYGRVATALKRWIG